MKKKDFFILKREKKRKEKETTDQPQERSNHPPDPPTPMSGIPARIPSSYMCKPRGFEADAVRKPVRE